MPKGAWLKACDKVHKFANVEPSSTAKRSARLKVAKIRQINVLCCSTWHKRPMIGPFCGTRQCKP
ncbi:hypothetical protein F5Y03DRAFT_375308 [Xylaria venustula]|nr:hypothetical protein F5Y03DRAFT_375308 [Xylaria venustula]